MKYFRVAQTALSIQNKIRPPTKASSSDIPLDQLYHPSSYSPKATARESPIPYISHPGLSKEKSYTHKHVEATDNTSQHRWRGNPRLYIFPGEKKGVRVGIDPPSSRYAGASRDRYGSAAAVQPRFFIRTSALLCRLACIMYISSPRVREGAFDKCLRMKYFPNSGRLGEALESRVIVAVVSVWRKWDGCGL